MGKQENIKKALAVRNVQKSLSDTYTPFNAKQLLSLAQRTPVEHIYKRPAKGGGEWEYVTGVYIKKVLNAIFGFMWNFEAKQFGREGDSIWVLGRLTVQDNKGHTIFKEQFGRADVKFVTEYEPDIGPDGKQKTNKWGKPAQKKIKTNIMLDYGNDLKAAMTDALKKCASEFGIASDIYGKNEFKDLNIPNPEPTDDEAKNNNAEIISRAIDCCKRVEQLAEIGLRLKDSKIYTPEQKKALLQKLTDKNNELSK